MNDDNVTSLLIQDVNCDIQEKLIPLFKKIYKPPKALMVLNMLPLSAQALPLEGSSSAKAEWLCFESTLEILKLCLKLKMDECTVVAIGSNTDGESSSSTINPWGGVSRGIAISADLEVRQRVISADLRCDIDENAFSKLIRATTSKTTENRIVITNEQLLQPVLKRYDLKVRIYLILLQQVVILRYYDQCSFSAVL